MSTQLLKFSWQKSSQQSVVDFHCVDMWSHTFYDASKKLLWGCNSGAFHHMVLPEREEALH